MNKKRALITGITGFVGPHLAELLSHQNGIEVHGIYREENAKKNQDLNNRFFLHKGNLMDPLSIQTIIRDTKPDFVFHLAAQSSVANSWKNPEEILQTNILSTLHLLEAIRSSSINPVIQIACSSEQYGLIAPENLPITEECPFNPLSPYSVSKISCDFLGFQYFKSYQMNIVRTRAFNHTGPGQTDQYVCSSFAKKIVEIEKGLRPPILFVGNLDAVRDFSDVRDIAQAYYLSVTKGLPGEAYIIASGKGRSIREVLNILLAMTDVPIKIETDLNLLRPSDIPATYGNSTKFKNETGWNTTISFEQTLLDLLNDWRTRI